MPHNNFDIPIFYGTYSDLSKIDLSFINASIIKYGGTKFRKYLKSILAPSSFNESYSFITSEFDEGYIHENDKIKRYAIVPADITKPFKDEHWQHFHQLMLSIYPSDFSLIRTIHINSIGGAYNCNHISPYGFRPTGEGYFDNFMLIAKTEYAFVKKYITNYFSSSFQLKYLKYILSVYSNSFLETKPIYQYISLIICLEVIVEGKEQLTYRIKRNTALICGESVESCTLIYKNIDQLYKLRSAIVHGEIKPSYKNFKEYHSYLKMLVARLIRELVVHNIQTITELNEKITALGYGQNFRLSNGYVRSKYPIVDNIHLSYNAIQKY